MGCVLLSGAGRRRRRRRNFAYDAGYGAGPAVFGLFAARTGYPATFALTGILVLAVLPAARRERKAVSG